MCIEELTDEAALTWVKRVLLDVDAVPYVPEMPRSKQPELNMYLNTRKQSLVKIHYTSGAIVIHSFI
jgi:hypothetical protein